MPHGDGEAIQARPALGAPVGMADHLSRVAVLQPNGALGRRLELRQVLEAQLKRVLKAKFGRPYTLLEVSKKDASKE